MEQLYTSNGDRPDLAALPINLPEGFIGGKIMPAVPVVDKSGTVYYRAVTADSAAQTGRSAGTAPTANRISTSSTTYTAAEVIKRGNITPDEAKQMGGIEKADEVGALWAKRQVQLAKESAICTIILGKAKSATFDPQKFRTQAQTADGSIRTHDGRKVLIGATKTLKRMCELILTDTNVGALFARIVSGGSPEQAVQGFNFAAWKAALALWAGVDEVLAGDDSIWGATAYAEKIAIAKVDNSGDVMSHKYLAVLGKVFQYLPDGTNEFEVESTADRVAKDNLYDASAWYEAKLLNTGALYTFDGVAA